MATKKNISYWGVSCEMDEPMFDSYGGRCVDEACEIDVCGAMLAELSWKRLCERAAMGPPYLLKATESETHSREEVGVKMEPRYPCCVTAA